MINALKRLITYNKTKLPKRNNKENFEKYLSEMNKMCPTYPVCSKDKYQEICSKSINLFNQLVR